MVAAAIVGAAVIGGVATGVASSNAASATENATNSAVNEQEWAIQQQENLSAPYRALGSAAIGQYESLLGLGPNGAAGELQALQNTPGYQFTKQQGEQSTVNQASAMGLGLSGNTLEGLDQFNTGLADQTYQNALTNSENAVTIGQNAAAGTGTAIAGGANNISSALINQGNTIAGIDVNEAAGLTKALSGASSNYLTMNTLASLQNPGGGGGNISNVPGLAGAQAGGFGG
jgi:hypothetical protein